MLQIEYQYKELLDSLSQMDEGLQYKAINRALTPAVKPITQRMKAIAPTGETGKLKQAIGKRSLSKGGKQRLGIDAPVAVIIGPNRTKVKGNKVTRAAIGMFLEFGTERMKETHEFMQPALSAGESGMQQRFFQGLQAYLNKISD